MSYDSPKFPDMKHVPWSEEDSRRNKRLQSVEGMPMTEGEVVITEKMDGGNACITKKHTFARSHAGEPRHKSFDLLKKKRAKLSYQIPDNLAIYGEWLHAKHSIKYTELPSYFLVFAVYDMEENIWFSWDETVAAANRLGLETVPVIERGNWDEIETEREPEGTSHYGDTREGYVIRRTHRIPEGEYVQNAAKCVRHNHVQTEERHWRKGSSYEENQLTEEEK